jgi:rhodanese-related sulfurtransferase
MSDDKDPLLDEVKAFVEKVRNKDPEALALMDRINAENAGRRRGYEAGKRDAFQKFPWPFVMLGGFAAWAAAGYWLVSQYPLLLLPLSLGAAAL